MSKGLQKYKRVALRLRQQFQDSEFNIKPLEEAIWQEIGVDPRTIKKSIEIMKRLKLLIEVEQVREFGVHPARRFKLTPTQDEYF